MTDRPSAAETVIKDVSSMRWPGEPPDDSAELARRAEALAAQLGVDDLDALTDRLLSLRKARRKDEPRPRRCYDLPGALPESGLQAAPLDPDDALSLAWGRKPRKALASWGLSGRYVRVGADAPFSFARIRFALPLSRLGHLYPGTVVAARWDPAAERFRLIPASGYSETGEYLYAQITRPGLFTAIGLPRDPRALLALRLLATLAPWAQASAHGGAPIAQPMLEALLSQPLLRQFKDDTALRETYGYRRRDFPLSDARLDALDFSGGRIDAVLDRLPELDLLDVLDDPNRMVKPVPDLRLPEEWPLPRHRWQSLGPANVTGRIKALAIHPEDGDVLYAGAAGGGVWKTVNGGRDWFPTMHDERSLAIGGLAIAPSAPEVLYAATGEWTGNDDRPETPSGMGAGVYRTSDGGAHWELCAPVESFLCTSVAVDPRNADRVFVGGNRGLHLSEDGGLSWRNVAVADGKAEGCGGTVTSIVMAHDEPDRMYVGIHGRGVFRSVDGGASWHPVIPEPEGPEINVEAIAPKIALGRHGVHGSHFVAIKLGDAVFASIDGGDRYARLSGTDDRALSMVVWCNTIAVHPADEASILAGSKSLCRTADGGISWLRVGGYRTPVHEDQQAIIFDPNDANHAYLATDGGVYESRDGGVTWTERSTDLCAAQAYNVGVSNGPALRCGASLQDYSAHVFEGDNAWTDLNLGEDGSIHFVPGRHDQVHVVSRWSSLAVLQRRSRGHWDIIEDGPDIDLRATQPLAATAGPAQYVIAIDADRDSLIRRPPRGGDDWCKVFTLADGRFTAICTSFAGVPTLPLFCAGDNRSRVWRSSDGGDKWRLYVAAPRDSATVATIVLDPRDSDRMYIGTKGGARKQIWRIDRDTGVILTLSQKAYKDGSDFRWDFTQAAARSTIDDTLVSAFDMDICHSTDGGFSWQRLPGKRINAKLMAMLCRNVDDNCLIATHGAGVYSLSM